MTQDRAPEALLRWYVSVGAKTPVGATPRNRFAVPSMSMTEAAEPAAVSAPAHSLSPVAQDSGAQDSGAPMPALRTDTPAAPLGAAEAILAARDLAAGASSLEVLAAAIRGFDGIGLKETAKNMVFSDGVPGSALMIIGEAPGRDEDRTGKPFVGQSGQLMDRMLAYIGLTRTENVYISNILNWWPPGNRKPSSSEIAISMPFIERHIALASPEILLLMGDTAGKTLLPVTQGITRYRGQWYDITPGGGPSYPAMASFHPAFLLRSPARKREAWHDLLTIRKRLDEMAG